MASHKSDIENMALPPTHPRVRRVITGHDSSGKSVIVEDRIIEPYNFVPQAATNFSGLYRHDELPANNSDKHDEQGNVVFTDLIATKPNELTSGEGSVFWTVDTPPHTRAVRTKSIRTCTYYYSRTCLNHISSHSIAR